MNIKKFITKSLTGTTLAIGMLFFVPAVFAAGDVTPTPTKATPTPTPTTEECPPQYAAPCPTGNVVVNKKVQKSSNGFVDNLGVNDPKYAPGATIPFQIIVTNTGNGTLPKVVVKDVLPDHLTHVSGDLDFEINNLKAGESKEFTIHTKALSADKFPANTNVICVTNNVVAAAGDQSSEDTAQVCIEKGVTVTPTPAQKGGVQPTPVPGKVPPVTKGGLQVFPAPDVTVTPPTGPGMLSLLGLIPTGALGYFFRRRSSHK